MCILTAALETLDFGLFFTGEMAMNAMEPGYPRLVFAAKSRIEGHDYGVEISPTGRVMFRTLAEAEAYKESISWLQFAADLIDGSPAVAAGEYEETAPSPASADPPPGFEPVAWVVAESQLEEAEDRRDIRLPLGWRLVLTGGGFSQHRQPKEGEWCWRPADRVLFSFRSKSLRHGFVIEPIPAEAEPADVAASAGEDEEGEAIDASFEVVEESAEAKPVKYPQAIGTDVGHWRWGVLVDADKVIPFKVKDSRDSLLRKLQANPAHYVSDYFARSREDFLAGNADQRPRREKPEQPVAAQPAEAVAEPEPEPEPKYAVVEGRGETGSPSWGVQLAADKTSPVAEFGGGEDGRSCADNAAKNMNSGEGPLFDSYVPMAAADFYGKAAGFVYKESARKVCGKLNAGVMRERDIPCWRDIDVAAIDISELDEGPDDASQAEA